MTGVPAYENRRGGCHRKYVAASSLPASCRAERPFCPETQTNGQRARLSPSCCAKTMRRSTSLLKKRKNCSNQSPKLSAESSYLGSRYSNVFAGPVEARPSNQSLVSGAVSNLKRLLREGANIVVLEPGVAKSFPDGGRERRTKGDARFAPELARDPLPESPPRTNPTRRRVRLQAPQVLWVRACGSTVVERL